MVCIVGGSAGCKHAPLFSKAFPHIPIADCFGTVQNKHLDIIAPMPKLVCQLFTSSVCVL